MPDAAARGYVEGGQLDVFQSFHVRKDGLDERTREVLARKPDVILTRGTAATEVLLQHTRTIPVVTSVSDPVGGGLRRFAGAPRGGT